MGRGVRAPGSAASLLAAVALVFAGAPVAAATATLPANLGPPVRVGLLVGTAAVADVTVTASVDPDRPSARSPALSVHLAAGLGAADAAADAFESGGPAPTPSPPTATSAAPSAPSLTLVEGAPGALVWALGQGDLALLGSALTPSAAAALQASNDQSAIVAFGPAGESVVAPAAALGPADASAPRLVASGAEAGPYATLALADAAVSVLRDAGLWALPEIGPGAGSATAPVWYARVLASAAAPSRTAAARASFAAAQAALRSTAAAAAVTPVIGGGGEILVVAGGEAALAPALWLGPAPGALELIAPGAVGARYAGALIVSRSGPTSPLQVVNDVPLERYVEGVVAAEMPATWPLAALEAQAIASRTYALWARASRAGRAYVLSDGTVDQVYGGIDAETAATNAATLATLGEVVTYDGAPIDAVYEPDSGGYTADSADVWGTALPYLVAEPEPKGYVSPYRWRIRLSARTLGDDAAAEGAPTGVVQSLVVAAREAVSGRVIELLLEGPTGRAEFTDDLVRTALDLPSNLFRVRTATEVTLLGAGGVRTTRLGLGGASVLGAGGEARLGADRTVTLRGAAAMRSLDTTPGSYTFVGRGLGPGLGMSQDGALYMAERGATARAILLYYYRGTRIEGDDGEGSG